MVASAPKKEIRFLFFDIFHDLRLLPSYLLVIANIMLLQVESE